MFQMKIQKEQLLIRSLIVSFFLCVGLNSFAQDSTKVKPRIKLFGIPAAYYTPETGFAVGALGVISFNWKNDSINARISNITLGFSITVLDQLLFYLPFNLLLKNDQLRVNGEIGYYKYTYFYSGIGNVSGTKEEKEESFRISFPRLRLTFLKRVSPRFFIGFRGAFDSYSDLRLSENSKIAANNLNGIQVGNNLGFGPAILYDSRSSIFYPRKGFLVDVNNTNDLGKVVSDYAFSRLIVDASVFVSPFKKSVVGYNLYYQQNTGNVPFYHLSLLGGNKKLRGQFEGEFREKYAWQTQLEWRQEFMKNWGAAAFLGVGWIAPNWKSLQLKNQHVGYGVGIRYKVNKKDHINIRLDVGFGNGKAYPYITIGEAF
jgi:hypothetical protein